jgi:hypothetical protein
MCSQDDLDLVRADEDGMIDRREDEGHPVNTDPPKSPDARLGALYEALQDHELLSPMAARWARAGGGVKDAFRRAFLTAFPADRVASRDEADSGVEGDARQAHVAAALREALWGAAMDGAHHKQYSLMQVCRLLGATDDDLASLDEGIPS